jgi:dipeptidyl aminopeptidase/acylaminoacyl peptidase
VVLVHGGPWSRSGAWGWRAEAQFLASRGWVVIEPQFRGSTGYGRAHLEAGWRQWGRAMQDDLADAVGWAVARGWVDPKRVCIAGGSYGGYAALMGLVRDPQLYRCGAAWMAVTDPRLLFRWSFGVDVSDEVRQYGLPTLIGDPVADAARLAEVAPVEQAGRIAAPLLLAFGGNDRRVPIEHGERMRAALRAAGHEPEYVVYAEEGHGWLKLDNRLDFYRRLERFLAEHLK